MSAKFYNVDMKKMLMIFLIAFMLFGQVPTSNAQAATSIYAKIQKTGVNFCSVPSSESAMFEIPYSYFVKIDYIVDDFYKVTYKNLDGYVKREDVALMSGEPQTPYPNVSPFAWEEYVLYETPHRSSRAITNVSAEQNVSFYGTIMGENAFPNMPETNENKLWYYVSITNGDRTVNGYAYNRAFANINIPENKETFNLASEDLLTQSGTKQFSSLSVGTKIILIVAISVPSVLILYFLIKPGKIMQMTKSKKKTKREPRKTRHGDYYEFDESEL